MTGSTSRGRKASTARESRTRHRGLHEVTIWHFVFLCFCASAVPSPLSHSEARVDLIDVGRVDIIASPQGKGQTTAEDSTGCITAVEGLELRTPSCARGAVGGGAVPSAVPLNPLPKSGSTLVPPLVPPIPLAGQDARGDGRRTAQTGRALKGEAEQFVRAREENGMGRLSEDAEGGGTPARKGGTFVRGGGTGAPPRVRRSLFDTPAATVRTRPLVSLCSSPCTLVCLHLLKTFVKHRYRT